MIVEKLQGNTQWFFFFKLGTGIFFQYVPGKILPEDKSLEYYFIYHKQKQQYLPQTSLLYAN